MVKVLVTGAGGFVGQHLIEYLLENGDEVYAATYGPNEFLTSKLDSDHALTGDLTEHQYVKTLLKTAQPDIIYHLAALAVVHNDVPRARRALENNIGLQYNLLEEVRQCCPQTRIVAVCSGNVYGAVKPDEVPIKETTPVRPLNAYSVSKLSQELLALEYFFAHQLDVVILRPFNHTGPGQSEDFVIPAFAKQFALIKKGQQEPTLSVGNLETARDFTDVKDMVRAYTLAATKGKAGEIYNIGSGKSYQIGEILASLSELAGVKVQIKVDESRVRGVDVPILQADSSKFITLTGWQPQIPFHETLSNVLSYWEEKL